MSGSNGLRINFNASSGLYEIDLGDLSLTIREGGRVMVTGSSVITDGDGNRLVPAGEGDNAPGVISSSPDKGAFDPATTALNLGPVHLKKVSNYLSCLPLTARAELLMLPQSTADIFKRFIGSWNEDFTSIPNIDETFGFNYADETLTGMRLGESDVSITLEKEGAIKVNGAFLEATKTGEPVTTGLAIGTQQIIRGTAPGSCDTTVTNNIFAKVDEINKKLKDRCMPELCQKPAHVFLNRQFTMTCGGESDNGESDDVVVVSFVDGSTYDKSKSGMLAVTYPVALRVLPPGR